MKTSMPPRLPTNKPRIRRMRLHAGLATSLDPINARIPTMIPTTMPVKLPNRAKLVPKSISPPTFAASNIPLTRRTIPPIRTRNLANVSKGTCDAIFQLLIPRRSGYLGQEFEQESVIHASLHIMVSENSCFERFSCAPSSFPARGSLQNHITTFFPGEK